MNGSQSRNHVSDRPEKPRKSIANSACTTPIQFGNVESPFQTILFVAKELEILEARRLLFETLGFSVLIADCENKAQSLLRLASIDAVVVGCPPGDTHGEQIVRKIRKAYGDLPVVLLSNGPSIPQSLLQIVDTSADKLARPLALLDALREQLEGSPPAKFC